MTPNEAALGVVVFVGGAAIAFVFYRLGWHNGYVAGLDEFSRSFAARAGRAVKESMQSSASKKPPVG